MKVFSCIHLRFPTQEIKACKKPEDFLSLSGLNLLEPDDLYTRLLCSQVQVQV